MFSKDKVQESCLFPSFIALTFSRCTTRNSLVLTKMHTTTLTQHVHEPMLSENENQEPCSFPSFVTLNDARRQREKTPHNILDNPACKVCCAIASLAIKITTTNITTKTIIDECFGHCRQNMSKMKTTRQAQIAFRVPVWMS